MNPSAANAQSFSSLDLHADLLVNLATLGYTEMTAIQAESLPPILAGRDVIAQGKTGSGKTAAFGLGLLNSLDVRSRRIQALVLCPTRELAAQVSVEIRRLARQLPNIKVLTLCGGMPFGPQVGSLEHAAHVVVGTPGRIVDHLRRNTMTIKQVHTLVLDEADRMLDMGFQEAVDTIIEQMPSQRQTLLFSATFPDRIDVMAKRIMRKPVRVVVASVHDDRTIAQHFYPIMDQSDGILALRLLLLAHRPGSSVVFCNTKRETVDVAAALCAQGFSALALNGDFEQRDRDQTLVRFANKSVSVLVATDVAARGLDIESLDAVFNFYLPHEPAIYIHRIGRTGRAGSRGMAFTLHAGNGYKLTMLADFLHCDIDDGHLPEATVLKAPVMSPVMATLQISGGKKQKLRPGDILGALTAGGELVGKQVGKIHIFDHHAYVAVQRGEMQVALRKLGPGKLKGRSFRVRPL